MADLLGLFLDTGYITAVLLSIVTFLAVYISTRRRASEPPGPHLWPIIGNLLSFAGRNPLDNLRKLRQKYGDVYGLYIGKELNVVLSGYSTIHDALIKNGRVFSRRPDTGFVKLIIPDPPLVFANDGDWKSHRQFTMNTLKELCLTNQGRRAEQFINEELSFFIAHLNSYQQPVDLKMDIVLSFANIMASIIHGERFNYGDEKFNWYLETIAHEFKIFARNKLITDCFSFLSKMPIDVLNVGRRDRVNAMFSDYFSHEIKENVKSYEEGSEDCLVKWYMTAAQTTKSFNIDNIWRLLHDLMAAGTETTANTLRWIILHLMLQPDVQAKVREEVDKTIGLQQTPSLSDRANMPYTEATILEGLRIGHAVPLAVPHFVSNEVKFHGFVLPKDTTIMINLHSVLKDPVAFPEPEVFRPERFLDNTGTKVVIPKEFIPFSLGQRSCLGESLARIELFLYLTTLLQKFEFKLEDPDNRPSVEGVVGITYSPIAYKTRIVQR